MSIDIKTWGNNIWFLFHGLIHKLDESKYSIWKDDFIYIFTTICNNLPCPECSNDANNIIKKTNFKNINSKEDLKKFIFNFHNYVNKKLKKPEFKFDKLNIYDKINIFAVINNFILIFKLNSNIPQLMSQSFHRQKTLPIITLKLNNLTKYIN
tara:strand:- start:1515 stop:1973 length:459 start_codon:yes stop_codon:yes gene_type:complete